MGRADETFQGLEESALSHPIWQAMDRRAFLRLGGAAGMGALLSSCKRDQNGQAPADQGAPAAEGAPLVPPFKAELARFPEKTDLLLLTDRPPQLETPMKYFLQDFTPNDAFFVRWHLAVIPLSVDANAFRLTVGGHVKTPLSLSLDDLRQQFEPVSVAAVNQCSGNSRSLFEPRIPGGQWGNGAMGNALWTGARLKDVLEQAGVKPGAVDVSFQGLDRAPLPTTPQFVKSLSYPHAADGEVIIAYQMNNQPLPMLNGFPCRLIVPGWYATYWVKALNDIKVLAEPFKGFWMDKAYRVPMTENYSESPGDLAKKTTPISKMTVRSVIVSPESGNRLAAGKAVEIQGLAMDDGTGITAVDVSTDGGKTWAAAQLDLPLGRYAWRRFRFQWTPGGAGTYPLMSRATNSAGKTQVKSQWNRSGYARDVMDPVNVTVA